MGQDAREFVRRNFLITRHLGDYLALMSYMGADPRGGPKKGGFDFRLENQIPRQR